MYQTLQQRLQSQRPVILDGAVGTQLQRMGVPMDNFAWAATALHTHPDTVSLMHRHYLSAGARIITTNTYSSARHNFEPVGLGDLTAELNYRAVRLAREARERAGSDAAIAGSLSAFGVIVGGEEKEALHRHARPRSEITERQARANFAEQAALLAEAGVDFLLLEATGSMTHRAWLSEAARATGLPLWLGFRAREQDGAVRLGYTSRATLAESLAGFELAGFDALALFHTSIAATTAGIGILRAVWPGPLAVYPEADRTDYTLPQRDESVPSAVAPAEFVAAARDWIGAGVQVVGGCCGIDLPYIRALHEALGDSAAQ